MCVESDFTRREVSLQITGDRKSLVLSVTRAESVGGLDEKEQRHVINLHVLEVTWDAL